MGKKKITPQTEDTPLSPKQKRFVDEYLIDLNASAAAIRAGYAKKSARITASRLLTKDNISKAVRDGKAERSEKTKIDAEWVLKQLAKIATTNLDDIGVRNPDGTYNVDLSRATRDQMYAIQEIKTRTITGDDAETIVLSTDVKMHDKMKALELVGKHVDIQAWKDRVKYEGDPISKVVVEVVSAKKR
jgi:phage terminase small subunit